ncbi:MAG TPA: hypothetical protein VK850_18940 [Candidatus Binatia bacterium]|nr:hypothetical protein [Candidatus Binatia bacterium]
MDTEEAGQIAKCIVEAPTAAGLQIVPLSKNRVSAHDGAIM